MKQLFIIVVLCISIGAFAAIETPKKQKSPVDSVVVFLIHGLLGDSTTFGDLDKYLKTEFEGKIKSIQKVRYVTESDDGKPFQFTPAVYAQVVSHFVEMGYAPNQPFVFIAHSQGGLVSLKYVYDCIDRYQRQQGTGQCTYENGVQQLVDSFKNMPLARKKRLLTDKSLSEITNLIAELKGNRWNEKVNFPVPANLRQIITMGTPFWGSATASYLRSKGPWWNRGNRFEFLVSKMPADQVEQLAFGSQQFVISRKQLLSTFTRGENPQLENYFEKIAGRPTTAPGYEGVDIFTISGTLRETPVKGATSYLAAKILGLDKMDSDIVVGIPSRLDFNYYLENRTRDGSVLQGRTHLAKKAYFLNAAHVPLNLGDSKVDGIAEFKLRDDYPTRNLIKLTLLELFDPRYEDSLPVPVKGNVPQKLSQFGVELKIYFPRDQEKLTLDQSMVKITENAESKGSFVNLQIANSWLSKLNGFNTDYDKQEMVHFESYFHTGEVKSQYAVKGTDAPETYEKLKLDYTLTVPGFKEKKFTLVVNPTLSTYAEVYLDPLRPFPSPNEAGDRSMADGNGKIFYVLAKAPLPWYAGQTLLAMDESKNLVQVPASQLKPRDGVTAPKLEDPRYCWANIGDSKAWAYGEYTSDQGIIELKHGQSLRVLGRFGSGGYDKETKSNSQDRYLILAATTTKGLKAPGGKYLWVDTNKVLCNSSQ